MSLLERLMPPACLLCGQPGVHGRALCAGCLDDLPWVQSHCSRCAVRLPATQPGPPAVQICGTCQRQPPPFTSMHVPFAYATPIDWLILRLKFRADLAAGRVLGGLLADRVVPRAGSVDAVVPVPLHRRRLRARGFNQSAELGRPIAHALGAPFLPGGLARLRLDVPQMELPAHRRRGNVRNGFGVTVAPGRHVLLVDDVVTTASTVREAARQLLTAGVERVTVMAVARA